MSADHDHQSANYCSQCSAECVGVDVVASDDEFLGEVLVSDAQACIVVEESVLRIYHHADSGGDGQ